MGRGGSKRLSNREEILKVAHVLLDAPAGQTGAGGDARVDQILLRSLESEEGRRVDTVAQVYPQRPYRRAVADAKPYGVHHVIEVLKVLLVEPEREVAQAGIGIAGIVKGHSSDIISDQGKTEFGLIEQEGRAAQGETRGGIARPRLIFRKAPMRSAA